MVNLKLHSLRYLFTFSFFLLFAFTCNNDSKNTVTDLEKDIDNNSVNLTIAFGSCNNQRKINNLWDDILAQKPDVWIWGGDIIYSDTDNPEKLRKEYQILLDDKQYQQLTNTTKILGTWDDHDYGKNDGGEEYEIKSESQQLFLDFMGVPKIDERRTQPGIYHSELIETDSGSVKIITLDTRFFRTELTPSEVSGKRYQANEYGEGTILGESQWKWLETELYNSKADFNIIISSIQFLSDQHGYETWGNFPHEVDKMKDLLVDSKAKNPIILSGDRHISEFSQLKIEGLENPLIDFTSSGLTHSYSSFSGEPNPYRQGEVVNDKSFGLLKFNFALNTVIMEMRGDDDEIYNKMNVKY